ncbi:hypothetical protein V1478_010529, partial [Vespula squamosa]
GYTKVFREHVSRLTGSKSSVTEGGGGSGEGGENGGEWEEGGEGEEGTTKRGTSDRACGFYLRSSYSTALMAALPNMEGLIWEVGSNLHPAISELHIPAATHNGYVRLIAPSHGHYVNEVGCSRREFVEDFYIIMFCKPSVGRIKTASNSGAFLRKSENVLALGTL